jgi:hypothetical protein
MKFKVTAGLFVIGVLLVAASAPTAGQTAEEISEITLQMTPGTGGGMDFKVVLRRDGTASYKGGNSQKLKGKFKGTISEEEFGELAKFISDRNFFSIKNSIISLGASPTSMGMPTVLPAIVSTTIVASGRKKLAEYPIGVKVNEREEPPKELIQISNAIMNVATKIRWTKDSN